MFIGFPIFHYLCGLALAQCAGLELEDLRSGRIIFYNISFALNFQREAVNTIFEGSGATR